MNEIANLIFRAIVQSTSHKNAQPHPSQNIATLNHVQQAYSLPTHLQTFNYTQQLFLSPSQCSTFSHTSKPSPSNYFSTTSRSSQVSPSLNNSKETPTKVIEGTVDYDWLNQNLK